MATPKIESRKISDFDSYSRLVEPLSSYRNTKLRWLALAFASFLTVGHYFCYDNPSALQDAMTNTMNLTTTEINWFYSIYSLPNMILPFFGGVIIDKIGVRIGVFVFSVIVVIGQSIFCYGAYVDSFWMMLSGRFVFGFGGESLSVAQSTIIAYWFHDKELAFAMGLNISFGRLGSALNFALLPELALITGKVWIPIMVGIFFCIASLLSGMALNYLDKLSDEKEGLKEAVKMDEKMSFEDLKSFSSLYWLLVLDCLLIYGAYFSFTNNANDILVNRFGFKSDESGFILTIIFLISAIITPIFGRIVDNVGKRVFLMQYSITLLICSYAMITLMNDTTSPNYLIILPLTMLEIFSAIYAAAIWPCFPLVVNKRALGTAFGIATAFQNAMLTGTPIVVGIVHDSTKDTGSGYFYTQIMLTFIATCGWICNTLISMIDGAQGSILNSRNDTDFRGSVIRTLV